MSAPAMLPKLLSSHWHSRSRSPAVSGDCAATAAAECTAETGGEWPGHKHDGQVSEQAAERCAGGRDEGGEGKADIANDRKSGRASLCRPEEAAGTDH